MGNPAWGHGYHAGEAAGRAEGRTEGAAFTAGVAVAIAVAAFAVQKVRERRNSRSEALVEGADSAGNGVPEEEGPPLDRIEDDPSEA